MKLDLTNRRSFIKKSAMAATFLGVLPRPSLAANENKPIVLSTWNFGLKANEVAWDILSKNGTALDAVEYGVKLVEADPNERSVGYGGRPDRDGFVTLDDSGTWFRCLSV